MRIFTLFDREIHDHYLVIPFFVVFILVIIYNDHYIKNANCLILEPESACIATHTVSREQIIANSSEYVYIPSYLNYNGQDAYRERMAYGFQIYYCQPNNDTCNGHYDSFNAVDFPFGTVAHISDFIISANTCDLSANSIDWRNVGSSCFGIPDYMVAGTIWGLVIFVGYYFGIKPLIRRFVVQE